MRTFAALLFLLAWGSPAPAERIKVVDDVGTTVFVEAPPARVVCLSPGATEIIYALGAEGRLKAVSSFCDFPAAARELPQVGDFMNLSLEAILSHRPGLVVATGGVQKEMVLRLRGLSVPTVVLYPHSVEGVFSNIRTLGDLLAHRGEADALVRRMDSAMKQVSARARQKAARAGVVRVYFEVSAEPLMAIGPSGCVGDLVRMAGGKNIASNTSEEYPRMSPEFVVSADPEVIILSYAADPARAVEELRSRPGWSRVAAVRDGRVFADLDMDLLMRPGPRIVAGLSMLQQRLYPGK